MLIVMIVYARARVCDYVFYPFFIVSISHVVISIVISTPPTLRVVPLIIYRGTEICEKKEENCKLGTWAEFLQQVGLCLVAK